MYCVQNPEGGYTSIKQAGHLPGTGATVNRLRHVPLVLGSHTWSSGQLATGFKPLGTKSRPMS
jgi:hypothetical protein